MRAFLGYAFIAVALVALAAASSGRSGGSQSPPTTKQATTLWSSTSTLVPSTVHLPKEYGAEGAPPADLIIALHGYGGSASSFAGVAKSLTDKGNVVLIPQAPYPTRVGGFAGHDWFLLSSGEDALQKRAAEELVQSFIPGLIAEARQQYRFERVHLLGFSQGAIIALVSGVRNPDVIDSVTTFGLPVFDPAWFTKEHWAAAKGMHVLLAHGEADRVAPPRMSELADKILSANKLDVDLHLFDGAHRIPAEQLDYAAAWFGATSD